MNRIEYLLKSIYQRQLNLNDNMKSIKHDLEECFEKNINEAGVIHPGYFSLFSNILEKYKDSRIISQYMISEEEYTLPGRSIKIPIVDVQIDNYGSTRLQVLSQSLVREMKLDQILNV